jgi:HD-GYP domain-containing protein (c-di-GMP phosphodiesterase class II)
MAKKQKSKKRSSTRPPRDPRDTGPPESEVAGETDTEVERIDRAALVMPAGSKLRYQSIVSVPAASAGALDVDTVAALLDSHAQVANVRLRVLFPDGRVFFEAYPPKPKKGVSRQVPLKLPGHEDLLLRGPLPERTLQVVSGVIERVVALNTESGAQLQALDTERQRLSLVFDFSEKVCQLAAFDEVVSRFLADLTRILDAREGTFFALDPRRKDLYIRCSHGSRAEVVQGFRLQVGEGIAGAVAADGRARIVNNMEQCPDYVAKGNPIHNLISAPVTVRDQLVGVVNVNDRAGGRKPFSNRDLQLLVSLAQLGGVALDNARLYEEVRQLLLSTIESLTTAIDAKDQYALGHSRRVAYLGSVMAQRLKLDEQQRDMLQIAAMLHDIGNLAISEEVLAKPGPLSKQERAQIKQHPELGASILSPVQQLSAVLPGIVDHHERYDGRGYPRRLKGDEISLQGRLIALVDTFDAMTHDRPFRRACSAADALAEITAQSGAQFDPSLVPIFVECYREQGLERTSVEELIPPSDPGLDF